MATTLKANRKDIVRALLAAVAVLCDEDPDGELVFRALTAPNGAGLFRLELPVRCLADQYTVTVRGPANEE